MKKGMILLLSAAVAMFMLHSCKKDDNNVNTNTGDPCDTTTEPQYWFYGTVDGEAVDTRGACNSARIELDNAFQTIPPVMFGDKYMVSSTTSFRVFDDTLFLGNILVHLSVLAPDSLVDVTITGSDTTRVMPVQQFCDLLNVGEMVIFQYQMVQEGKDGGFITYLGKGETYQGDYGSSAQMEILANSGLGQAVFYGDTTSACICQAGFDMSFYNNSKTDTVLIDGTANLPFK